MGLIFLKHTLCETQRKGATQALRQHQNKSKKKKVDLGTRDAGRGRPNCRTPQSSQTRGTTGIPWHVWQGSMHENAQELGRACTVGNAGPRNRNLAPGQEREQGLVE